MACIIRWHVQRVLLEIKINIVNKWTACNKFRNITFTLTHFVRCFYAKWLTVQSTHFYLDERSLGFKHMTSVMLMFLYIRSNILYPNSPLNVKSDFGHITFGGPNWKLDTFTWITHAQDDKRRLWLSVKTTETEASLCAPRVRCSSFLSSSSASNYLLLYF